MLVAHGFVPFAAGTSSAQTPPATRPAGLGTIDQAASPGPASRAASVGRKKLVGCRVSLSTRRPRVASARPNRRERVRVFTVSIKYSGQPERDAGDYPTRQLAARAAALAASMVGEHGAPPVKVGVHESRADRHRVSGPEPDSSPSV